MKVELNAAALDQSLNVIGQIIGLPNMALVAAALYRAVDTAEIRGFDRGYEAAGEDSAEMYDDGYLDATHDFQVCPEAAQDQANLIEEQRDLAAAAISMDPTLVG